jgi:hypothetical protein
VSSTQQPWYQPGLRFCGSCCITLVYWTVWLALTASLAILIYVATARDLPVPDFVLRHIEARLAVDNLVIKFGHARLDPGGKILLENVQLRLKQFDEPLLTSRLVYVRRSFWSILAGQPLPDEIRLEGAVLQLPAMLSPSGTAEPLVRDLSVVLRHDEDLWHIDQLAGRIGQLTVTVQGDYTAFAHAPGGPPLTAGDVAAQFLHLGRQLVLQVHQFDAFEEPALAIRLDSQPGAGNTAAILFTARTARQPWAQPLTLGPVAATTTLRLDVHGEHTVRFHVAVQNAAYDGGYSAGNIRAILTAHLGLDKFSLRPGTALIAVGTVVADGETALAPVIRADLSSWPEAHATVATGINGEFLAAEVTAKVQERSARIRAEGRGSPEFINRVLAKHTPRAASYFVFGDPVVFNTEAVLGPGWHFATLTARVTAGRLDSHGVKISSLRGQIDIAGTRFLAHDARVRMGENYGEGSYWMDFATLDYRMLLNGRLRPVEINGWFRGDWWRDFWNDHFTFPTVLPMGDVDVNGSWKDPARTEYFGWATAPGVRVLGADFEQASALIYLRPNFTDGLALTAERAGGTQRVSGSFKRLTDAVNHETNRLEFYADSNLDSATYSKMTDGKMDSLLGNFQFPLPPHVHAQGSIDGKWPGVVAKYTFNGQAEGGFHYFGFPVESAQVAGGVTGDDVRLDNIDFAVAGGRGHANASVVGPGDARRLGFDAYLNGADLARSIRAVEEYQVARTGQKGPSVAESKFMKRASGGRLDVALSAQGNPGDLASFTGTGNASLTGAELGEIQLFGLLSQALSGLSLNFSSLKLDAARTSFRMENGRLVFPDLRITGSTAVIDARGDFVFATSALDFTAKFRPFEENRNILTAALGIVIKPITSILELKLTGPISKPEWSVTVGQSAPKPEATPATPTATPAPGATPATTPEQTPAPVTSPVK